MSAHAIFYKKLLAKSSFYYVFCFFCIGLVAANIIYSQKYNENMYGVMEQKNSSIITYLKHIWGTPLYNMELQTYKDEGRNILLEKWTEVQHENVKRIQNLEDSSRLYPYSPEIYYNLYLLYSENGDKEKAQENILKAQRIDPSIK